MSTENGTVESSVVDYNGLVGMVVQSGESGNTEVWFGIDLGAVYGVTSVETLAHTVQERIDTGKKPSGTLSKAINRIAHHRAQLSDALATLFSTHESMTAPKKEPASRKSAVWKARYAMLESMSNKILKMYAADFLPEEVDNFILSDAADRVALITKLTGILAEEKESEETADISA